jgi:hypothetical protein
MGALPGLSGQDEVFRQAMEASAEKLRMPCPADARLPAVGPGDRLSDLGRREDALAAIEEAVTIRRQLAAARPAVFGARLASSLKDIAAILAALGKTTAAGAVTAEAAELG